MTTTPLCLTAEEARRVAAAADAKSMPELLAGKDTEIDPDGTLVELAWHARRCEKCRQHVQEASRFGGVYSWMTSAQLETLAAQPHLF